MKADILAWGLGTRISEETMTDTDIRFEGVRILMKNLGTVEAERFIALINRERFDYTDWRKNQWADETMESLAGRARKLRDCSKS